MSSLRIQRIQAQAFKAFNNLDFKLNGRNLLAYGGNGAGKSSLYWLLYTFLQSAAKETPDVTKYFDPARPEHLLNVHTDEVVQAHAHICVTLDDAAQATSHRYTLSATKHGTKDIPELVKGNLASDFVTYRILFNFYRFRNSEAIDLWPIFESEILPFCYTTEVRDLDGLWRYLKKNNPFISGISGNAAKRRYDDFDSYVNKINKALRQVLDSISREAFNFYKKHFSTDDLKQVDFGLSLRQPSMYDRKKHCFNPPIIGFEVKLGGKILERPHTFLNEAKLTQLALSVRFGATLAHLQESPIKLLVLDDLLISLDMDNRMKVVDIILGDTFADYQKIILTHDLGFFNEFRRRIGDKHTDWSFQKFERKEGNIQLNQQKTELQKAQDYLHGQSLDEAAVFLRKAAESAAKRLREYLENKELPPGDFRSLTENLKYAKNKLQGKFPKEFYKDVLKDTPSELVNHLVPTGIADLQNFNTLNREQCGQINTKRNALRKLLTKTDWTALKNIQLIDQVIATTERVLNPAAHGGEAPLYEAEVGEALNLIQQLELLSNLTSN